MMVRNEARVIQRAIDSALPHVDAWVVCDTGSDDETPALVERHLGALPGRLYRTTFIDFGRTRTETIHSAREFCLERDLDYLLLLDADEVVEVRDPDWKDRLAGAPYMLLYDDPLSYRIQALVPAAVPWRYVGRTHEYLVASEPSLPPEPFDGIVLHDLGDGGSKGDKFVRDVRLLEQTLRENPSDERAWFYLGESHLNGQIDLWRALEAYTRRARMGGFEEEAWYAAYRRGRCLEQLPATTGGTWSAIGAYFAAWERRPWRAEPLYEVVRLACDGGQHLLGAIAGEFAIASVLARSELADDILFVDRRKNGPGILDWTSLCEYHVGEVERARALVEELLGRADMAADAERLRKNLAHFETRPPRLDERKAVEAVLGVCSHLRELGLNQACVALADGLAARPAFERVRRRLPDPWRLDFDGSICAYYVPGRREDARRLTLDLARRPDLPSAERDAVLRNRTFFVAPLSDSVLRSSPLVLDSGSLLAGYQATNPSVARGAEGLLVLVRTVNYDLRPEGGYTIPGFVQTRNLIGSLEAGGEVTRLRELQPGGPMPPDRGPVRGFEDARLVTLPWTPPERPWAVANHTHPSGDGRRAMFLLELELDDDAAWIRRAIHLHGIDDHKHQKNWMPAVVGEELRFVYSCDPTVILRANLESGRCKVIRRHRPPVWCGDLRGGSQLVAVRDEKGDLAYLAFVHGVLVEAPLRLYFHSIVRFDRALAIRSISPPFLLRERRIEFVAGLAVDGDELVVTWGEDDARAWMGRMKIYDALALCGG